MADAPPLRMALTAIGQAVKLLVVWCLCALPVVAHAGNDASCPVAGPRVQWQADFCMSQVGTDDFIAATPCIAEDSKQHYANDCAAKIKYKEGLCRLAIARGVEKRPVAQCLSDPSFMGITVRNGGVGG